MLVDCVDINVDVQSAFKSTKITLKSEVGFKSQFWKKKLPSFD